MILVISFESFAQRKGNFECNWHWIIGLLINLIFDWFIFDHNYLIGEGEAFFKEEALLGKKQKRNLKWMNHVSGFQNSDDIKNQQDDCNYKLSLRSKIFMQSYF